MQALKSKPPEQWRAQLDAVSDPDVRNRVACLIWWDFFGHRSVSNRWPHLDEFVSARYVPVSDTQLKYGASPVRLQFRDGPPAQHENLLSEQGETKSGAQASRHDQRDWPLIQAQLHVHEIQAAGARKWRTCPWTSLVSARYPARSGE